MPYCNNFGCFVHTQGNERLEQPLYGISVQDMSLVTHKSYDFFGPQSAKSKQHTAPCSFAILDWLCVGGQLLHKNNINHKTVWCALSDYKPEPMAIKSLPASVHELVFSVLDPDPAAIALRVEHLYEARLINSGGMIGLPSRLVDLRVVLSPDRKALFVSDTSMEGVDMARVAYDYARKFYTVWRNANL